MAVTLSDTNMVFHNGQKCDLYSCSDTQMNDIIGENGALVGHAYKKCSGIGDECELFTTSPVKSLPWDL